MIYKQQAPIVSGLLSVVLHIILLLLFFISIKCAETTHYIVPGETAIVYIQTRLAPAATVMNKVINKSTSVTVSQPLQSPVIKVKPLHPLISKATVTVANHKVISSPQRLPAQPTSVSAPQQRLMQPERHVVMEQKISGDQLNQLVIYLYRIINQHKVYPEMARELGNEGTVVVAFILTPTGEIANLHLVRSSGYRRLDRAALTTMRDSAPFPGITAYLRQPQPFKLQIEYALDIHHAA